MRGDANLRDMTVGDFRNRESRVGPGEIGAYRIVRELGRGGMGVVYEAVHVPLAKRVAIKLMQTDLMRTSAQVDRFIREGRAACQVPHANVVEVFELGTHEGVPYLVMALLDGITLAELLRASHRLPLSAVIELLLPIASAICAAHAAGVVHRDLKPSNIMLAREGGQLVPKLLDFGASKLDEPATDPLTNSGVLLGTLPYMSAEQVQSAQKADARSDQYSLAVIIYECLTGRPPFVAESPYHLMQAIMTEPVVAPSAQGAKLPAGFDAVLMRALERDARARFPAVSALGAALLAYASAETYAQFWSEFRSEDRLEEAPELAIGATLLDSHRADPAPLARMSELTNRSSTRHGAARLRAAVLLVSVVVTSVFGLTGEAGDSGTARKASMIASAPQRDSLQTPTAVREALVNEALVNEALARKSFSTVSPATPESVAPRSEPESAPGSARLSQSNATRRQRSRTVVLGVNDAPILE